MNLNYHGAATAAFSSPQSADRGRLTGTFGSRWPCKICENEPAFPHTLFLPLFPLFSFQNLPGTHNSGTSRQLSPYQQQQQRPVPPTPKANAAHAPNAAHPPPAPPTPQSHQPFHYPTPYHHAFPYAYPHPPHHGAFHSGQYMMPTTAMTPTPQQPFVASLSSSVGIQDPPLIGMPGAPSGWAQQPSQYFPSHGGTSHHFGFPLYGVAAATTTANRRRRPVTPTLRITSLSPRTTPTPARCP
jgi:hypothetical protein